MKAIVKTSLKHIIQIFFLLILFTDLQAAGSRKFLTGLIIGTLLARQGMTAPYPVYTGGGYGGGGGGSGSHSHQPLL